MQLQPLALALARPPPQPTGWIQQWMEMANNNTHIKQQLIQQIQQACQHPSAPLPPHLRSLLHLSPAAAAASLQGFTNNNIQQQNQHTSSTQANQSIPNTHHASSNFSAIPSAPSVVPLNSYKGNLKGYS